VLLWVAPAVAKAAMETGVARHLFTISDYLRDPAARVRPDQHLFPKCVSCWDCKSLGLDIASEPAALA
jgi:hypothetical protein